jgi:hypothetical protein
VIDNFHQQQNQAIEEEKVEDKEVIQKFNPIKKKQDGIFVDDDEVENSSYMPENDLLDDLLN